MLRKILRTAAAVLLTLLVAAAAYAGFVIYKGQEVTHSVVARAHAMRDLLSQLPTRWRQALLAVEDPNFESHSGVDLRTPGAGLTTITQSLVKWHYFDNFVPGWRKIDQTLLAVVLDRAMTKDEQLNLFLNTAYLGSVDSRNILGFVDGARVYFGKDLFALSEQEFLELVAMLISPNELSPLRGADKLAERTARIQRMLAGLCAPEGLMDVYYRRCARH
jgi:membrane peptidoglycan carboxypeptidase